MTTPGRIPCLVPHCRRTAPASKYPPGTVIICGKHWRMVDRRARRLKTLSERTFHDACAECEAIEREAYECALAHQGGVASDIVDRFSRAADRRARKSAQAHRAWLRCVQQATEAAMGIR